MTQPTQRPEKSPGCLTVGIVMGVLAVLAAGSVLYFFVSINSAFQDPDPVEVFRKHQAELSEFVSRIESGEVKPVKGRGYPMPQFLADAGCKHVFERDGCIVISFVFMPSNAVPQLWYCKAGFDPPPKELERLRMKRFFFWFRFGENWAALKWDD